MITPKTNLPGVYLKPGELHITKEPNIVTTVLGSCISVTMHSRRLGVGAICHGVLPNCDNSCGKCSKNCNDSFKYVECSIRHMINQFQELGVNRNEIEVKLFGGADVIQVKSADRKYKSKTVGKQNIEKALQIINSENLKLAVTDVGGEKGYKIIFNTSTGEVLRKRIAKKFVGTF